LDEVSRFARDEAERYAFQVAATQLAASRSASLLTQPVGRPAAGAAVVSKAFAGGDAHAGVRVGARERSEEIKSHGARVHDIPASARQCGQ
jgi:hypothetical protein